MDKEEAKKRIEEEFGSREGMLANVIINLSMTEQPCDVTFFERKPAINVKIAPQIGSALMYGAGAKKLGELLGRISLTNGETISFKEIWTINPMPPKGFTEEELSAVDLTEAEQQVGPFSETMRKMISDTYHCESREEEDKYLRRYIAS